MSTLATKALRRPLRPAASCPRFSSRRAAPFSSSALSSSEPSSSQQKLDVKPQSKLPDEKMRVLVQLYHQSDTFITKENLSQKIDKAFIEHKHLSTTTLNAETPFRALEAQVNRRRSLPKFGQTNEAVPYSQGDRWSERRSAREMSVKSTLYGVIDPKRPGFDVVKEEKERLERSRRQENQDS
ncbi:hypothetical protein PYCCODRAFT_876620 [Trametes coccinea BRFM310]|uniref:Uncharacterized protein n=1 Tax=Trametes coccinea (strain BRFM310) TaxID=1353009 RepID=A0A1Y2IDJ6_TRAC3|nr:hypothetical protein PYCCODRAFT_876620 [Trametes coccinea BRFM310]